MKRGRLSRFDACKDCIYWKIRQFISRRKENYKRFMITEIDAL